MGSVAIASAILGVLAVSGVSAQTVLVEWNFPDDTANAVADGGIAANTNRVIGLEPGSRAMSFSSAVGKTPSTCAATATHWHDDGDLKFWHIAFSTVQFGEVTISSRQRSSDTGPRDFDVQYRVADGEWLPVASGAVTVTNNWSTGRIDELALPSVCDDQVVVELRWIVTSHSRASGTDPISPQGVSQIDDIVVRGTRLPPAAPQVRKPTGISAAGFTANWDAVDEAEAYVLDVATTADFQPGQLDLDAALLIDFEEASKTSYASGTVTLHQTEWDLTDVLIGTLETDWKNGTKSARFRGHGTSAMTLLEDLPNGLGLVQFAYRRYGTDTQVGWRVQYSTDGGSEWTQVGDDLIAPATDDVQVFSNRLAVAGNVRIRIKQAAETGTVDRRMNIDDMILAPYDAGDYVPGFEKRAVAGTSAAIGELTRGWYYYRVRAVIDGVQGAWSAVMPVRVADTPPPFMMFLQ